MSFRQRDLDRLVKGALASGLTVEAVEIAVDGALRVLTRRPVPGAPVYDDAEDWVSCAGEETDHRRA